MASRTLQVNITGDPSSFNRTMRGIDTTVDRSGKKMQRFGAVAKGAMQGIGLAAGVGAAVGLKKAADAAIDAEASMAKVRKMVENSGISWDKHAKQIDAVIQKHSQLTGFDDEQLAESFGNMLRTTGNLNEAFKLNALAADIARTKGMELAGAQSLIARVYNDSFTGVKRLGIAVEEGATSQSVLADLQKKFAGQAEAYGKTTAGSLDRASVSAENLGESVGTVMTPLIAKGADMLVDLVKKLQEWWPKISRVAKTVFGTVREVINDVVRAVRRFAARNREDIDQVVDAFRRVARFARAVFEDVVIPIIKRLLPVFQGVFEGVVTALRGLIRIITGIINGDWQQVWDGIKDVAKGALKAVGALLKGLWGIFRDALKTIIDKAPGLALNIGKAIVKGIISGIKAAPGAIADAITGLIPGGGPGSPPIGRFGKIGKDAGDVIGSNYVASLGGGSSLGGFSTAGLQIEAKQGLSFIQSRFGGVRVSSGRRSPAENARVGGAPNSDHLTGLALDLVPSEGWTSAGTARLDRIAAWARQSPAIRWIGWRGVPGHGPGDHLHLSFVDRVAGDVAMSGGRLRAFGGKVRGVGDVIGPSGAARAAYAAGFRGQALINAVAIAGAESGYDDDATNLKYPDHSIGLWQINQLAHHGRYGSDRALMNPMANARAAWAVSGHGRNFGPWSTWPTAASRYMSRARAAVAALSGGGAPGTGGGGRGAAEPTKRKPGRKPQRVGGFRPAGGVGTRGNPNVGSVGPTILDPDVDPWMWNPAGDPEKAEKAEPDAAQEARDRVQADIAELLRQQVANQGKIIALAGQGPQILAAVIAAVDGGIGGPVGLGYQTPGYAGQLAAY